MSTRASQYTAEVVGRAQIGEHLVRITLGGEGLSGFTSTGIPDEWVGLIVPGQFQSRYYTVRSWAAGEMVLDVVVHQDGLVTEWARAEGAASCVGDRVTVTEPKGSFAPPADARWLILVGDLTAMPAMARILAETDLPTTVFAEVPEDLGDYLPGEARVHWRRPPGPGRSDLAAVLEEIEWPEGQGYFWMAGESAQMRAIRKHLMRVVKLPSAAYDVMGYWRAGQPRQPRAVDPGPIYRAGKAAGKSDEEIWADYDAAQQEAGR